MYNPRSLLFREQPFIEGAVARLDQVEKLRRCSFGSSLSLRDSPPRWDGVRITGSLLFREQPFIEGCSRMASSRLMPPSLLFREQPFIEGSGNRKGSLQVLPCRCSFGSSLSLRGHRMRANRTTVRWSLLFREQPFIEGQSTEVTVVTPPGRCSFGSSLSLRGCNAALMGVFLPVAALSGAAFH